MGPESIVIRSVLDIAYKSVSKMAIESKMLNPRGLIVLDVTVDALSLEKIPAESMLNLKLPIKSVSISEQVSFT